jgi:hypothetical protein
MQNYYFEFLNDDGENEVLTDTKEDGKPPEKKEIKED